MLTSSNEVKVNLPRYLEGKWPRQQGDMVGAIILSWYLQWFGLPNSHAVKSALVKAKPGVMKSSVCLLSMLLPRTHISALYEVEKIASFWKQVNGR